MRGISVREGGRSPFFSIMVFTTAALCLYAHASYKLALEAKPLRARCDELLAQRERLTQHNKEYADMLSSLGDPAADEYALVTELGKIPKGSYKLTFPEANKQ